MRGRGVSPLTRHIHDNETLVSDVRAVQGRALISVGRTYSKRRYRLVDPRCYILIEVNKDLERPIRLSPRPCRGE